MVTRALGSRAAGLHPEDEAAGWVAGTHVRIHGAAEVVRRGDLLAAQQVGLVAVVGLAEGGVGLPSDHVLHAGLGHQVALVGRVDEDAPAETPAGLHRDRLNPRAGLRHARLEIEALSAHDLHLGLPQEVVEDLLGHLRLEEEHHVLLRIVLVAAEVLGSPVLPGRRVGIVALHPLVELPREAADRLLLPDIGRPQSPAREAAEVPPRLDQYHGLSHARRRHGGRDAARRAAVHDDIMERRFGGVSADSDTHGCPGIQRLDLVTSVRAWNLSDSRYTFFARSDEFAEATG